MPSVALGDFFELRYEADTWPEKVGWKRTVDDPGQQIVRTLGDGVFTLDTTASSMVYEYYSVADAALQPGPGETFIASWRMRTIAGTMGSYRSDVKVDIVNGSSAYIDINLGPDFVSVPGDLGVPDQLALIAPNVWHDYRVVSTDLQEYDLYVDSVLAFHSQFSGSSWTPGPHLAWGDVNVGALTSVSEWQYFDVRVVPEPAAGLAVFALASLLRRGRSVGPPWPTLNTTSSRPPILRAFRKPINLLADATGR